MFVVAKALPSIGCPSSRSEAEFGQIEKVRFAVEIREWLFRRARVVATTIPRAAKYKGFAGTTHRTSFAIGTTDSADFMAGAQRLEGFSWTAPGCRLECGDLSPLWF